MQQVITSEQAKKITNGRTPMVPVEYEAAVKALSECLTFDEAKYWSDKASALAAWAKIYHSHDIDRKAKMLRLHAYRRMAELAQQIQKENGKGRIRTILEDQGLTVTEARQIDGVGRVPKREFERALNADKPPAPWSFSRGDVINELKPLRSMHTLTQRVEPQQLAALIDKPQRAAFREMITEIEAWLDELDQRLHI